MVGLLAATSGSAEIWDKTFPLSDQVIVEKVTFTNRVLNAVVGDLTIPKNIDRTKLRAFLRRN